MIDIETIGVAVDTKSIKAGTRDLDALNRSADKASRSADKLGESHSKASKNTEQLEKKTIGASAALAKLAVAFAAVAAVRGITRQIDEYTKFTAQIKLATRSQEQYNTALADVKRIATIAQADLSAIGVLYARLNNALRDLGVSQQQVARVTENVGLALKVSGATAAESTSAMLQLSQAFGSGVLRGEEFNAVNEAAPALMRALAESMGVPIGQLRSLAHEGQITSDVLLKAFGDEKLLEMYREQAKEVQTLSGAWQVLKNEFMETVAVFAKETGTVSALTASLNLMASAIKGVRDVFPKAKEYTAAEQAVLDRKNLEYLSRPNALGPLRESSRKKQVAELQKKLGISVGNTVPGMPSGGGTFAPNFDAGFVVTDVDKLHKEQKAIADKAIEENKRIREEKIKDLQKVLDFEEEMREMRANQEVEAAEKQAKIQLDWFDRTNKQIVKDIEARAKAEQDFFTRTNESIIRDLEKRGREYERMSDNITRSITDGLMRGFENGKSLAENFLDTLKNMFGTLILQPVIKMLVDRSGIASIGTGIASMLGGGTAMAGEAAGGGFGGIGNIFNLGKSLTNGLGGVQSAITGGIEKLGVMLATGNGGFLDSLGGFIGANAGTIGNVLPFAGAAFQALTGNIKGAAFTAAGAAIGSIIPGIGTAIGGMVGGLVGSLFGGKTKNPRIGALSSGSYVNGQYTAGAVTKGGAKKFDATNVGAITSVNEAFLNTLGSYMDAIGVQSNIQSSAGFYTKSGKKSIGQMTGTINGNSFGFSEVYGKKDQQAFQKYAESVLGSVIVSAIQASSLSAGIKSLFAGMTERTQVAAMMNATVNLKSAQEELADRFGLTVDAAARVSKATGAAGDSLIGFVNKLASSALAFKKPSEMILESQAAVAKGLGETFGTVVQDAVWTTVSRQVEVQQGGSAMRSNNINGYGGRGGNGYYALGHFFEAQKQFETITEQVLTYVDRVIPKTVALPATLAEYDALLKSINTTTAAGAKMFADIFAMRDQFIQFTAAVDGLKANVKGALFPMLSASEQQAVMQADLAKLFGELNLEIPGSIQELVELGKSIDYTTESGLDLAAAFPSLVQAFQQTRGQVDALMNSLGLLDINRFKTLVDFTRAQRYVENGISLDQLPSYDVGTSFVPQDGPAMIHRGERILTASENRAMSTNNGELLAEVRRFRDESQRHSVQLIQASMKMAKILDKFDNEGIVLSELNNGGERIVMDVKVTNTSAEAVPVDTTP